MNKLFLTLLIQLLSFSVTAKLVVISDLDDTVRQVNVLELDEASFHILADKAFDMEIPPFNGLNIIYNDLLDHNEEIEFYYLSASYPIIYDAKLWLELNEFPEGKVFQRAYSDEFNSGEFKKRKLREIIKNYEDIENVNFLFFGDNGEHDPEAYQDVVEHFGIHEQSQIYIRDVVTDYTFKYEDSRLPIEGINYFLTEKVLINSDLLNFLSNDVVSKLKKESIKDIPSFMVDNLDERIEDNICDKITWKNHPLKKIGCYVDSGPKALRDLTKYLKNLDN